MNGRGREKLTHTGLIALRATSRMVGRLTRTQSAGDEAAVQFSVSNNSPCECRRDSTSTDHAVSRHSHHTQHRSQHGVRGP